MDLDLIEFLLEQRANPNVTAGVDTVYEGLTPLGYASRKGYCAIVEELIRRGANVHRRTLETGGTALHEAAEFGRDDVCRLLLRHGADPCTRASEHPYDTPLLLSHAHNNPLCADLLNSERQRRQRTVAVIVTLSTLQNIEDIEIPMDVLTLYIRMCKGQMAVGSSPV